MNAADRQFQILALICSQGLTSYIQLSEQFKVSYRTVRRDVLALVSRYPLKIVRGRNGGVRLEEWFQPSSTCLTAPQLKVLMRVIETASPEDQIILNSIIFQFGPRTYTFSIG